MRQQYYYYDDTTNDYDNDDDDDGGGNDDNDADGGKSVVEKPVVENPIVENPVVEKPIYSELNVGKFFFSIFHRFHLRPSTLKTVEAELLEFKSITKNVPRLHIGANGRAFVHEVESLKVSHAFRNIDADIIKRVHGVNHLDAGFVKVIENQSAHLSDSVVFNMKKEISSLKERLKATDKRFAKLAEQVVVKAEEIEKCSSIKNLVKKLGTTVKRITLIGGVSILIGGTAAVVAQAIKSAQSKMSGCFISFREDVTNDVKVYKLLHLSASQDVSLYQACPVEIVRLLPADMQPGATPSSWTGECTRCPSESFYGTPDKPLDNETLEKFSKYKIWCHSASFGEVMSNLFKDATELLFGGATSLVDSFGSILKMLPKIIIAIVVIAALVLGYRFYRFVRGTPAGGTTTIITARDSSILERERDDG